MQLSAAGEVLCLHSWHLKLVEAHSRRACLQMIMPVRRVLGVGRETTRGHAARGPQCKETHSSNAANACQ